MPLTPSAYALLGLTAIVAALAGVLTFAVLRFAAAARDARRQHGPSTSETALFSSALQEAVAKLKAQERSTAARAEASERLNAEIISSLAAGLLVIGLRGEVRILNPAGRRLLHVRDGAPLDDYRALVGERTLIALVDECLTNRTAVSRQTVTLSGYEEGPTRLGVTVSPLSDSRGELHGAICLFADLTAVSNLEERLRLKESLAEVGEMAAGIAHEFRNGLATIHGYGKLLDLKVVPEAYRPYVEGIRAEVESLGQVVTNFLNFARPAELTLTRVALGAAWERIIEEARNDVRLLGGEISLSGEFGEVDGDEVLLRQAFSNLLRNAVEACAGASRPPSIVVDSRIDRTLNASVITVDDNGPGIAESARERVFRPFFTTKRNGTGLGLALVQKIIVFHNGRVRATTSPPGGARFEVSLPLAHG